MCRIKSHLLVAFGTFTIGLLATSFWIVKSNSSQCFEQELEADKTESVEITNPIESDNSYLFGQLTELSRLFGKTKKNTFYISKIETDNNKDFWLYVYWKEDNSILTLTPPFGNKDGTYLVVTYGRRLEIGKYVVKTMEEIRNSRKLHTRKMANDLIEKCVSSRNKLTIEKGK